MSLKTFSPSTELADADLVARSRQGDHAAFGAIVGRYQSLICAIAYSACGNGAQSEDIAQDVFLSAWKQMGALREPARLKSWLCGIARQTAIAFYRKDRREPAQNGRELGLDTAAPELQPSEQAFRRDEEAILWRALEQLDEPFREVLVLYYREHCSIERVAVALDLSAEAVRQRLSRGRKALQEEVTGMLEGALSRSAPGAEFKTAVMDALPAAAAGGGAAAAAKGGIILKGGMVGAAGLGVFVAAFLSPVMGMCAQLYGAETRKERAWVLRTWIIILLATGGYLSAFFFFPRFNWLGHSGRFTAVMGTITLLYMMFLCLFVWRSVKGPAGKEACAKSANGPPFEYRSSATLLGLPLIHVTSGCDANGRSVPAKGWIATGKIAYGVVFASGAFAFAPISIGAISVGVVGVGAFVAAGFAFGALSVGGYSMGAGAAGYCAQGGFAVGWKAALGGFAWAHRFALGGNAMAPHANDLMANRAIFRIFFFRHLRALMAIGTIASWLPMAVSSVWRRRTRLMNGK